MAPSSDRKGERETLLWWAVEKEMVSITGLYLDPSVCARNVRKHPLERTEEGSRLLRKLKLLKHTQESENVDIIFGKVVQFRSFQTKRVLLCNIQCWNILCVV